MIERVGARGVEKTPDAQLRDACAQMEGAFTAELMKALRRTVPESGLIEKGQGEELFTSMMDDAVAQSAAARQERGLGAALYRQLRSLLGSSNGAA
ncbi:MAG: rod-binding protein [Longimicrobiales bacterium]